MTHYLNHRGYTWQKCLPAAAILCAFVAVSLAIVGFNHILVVVLVTGGIVVLLGIAGRRSP